MAYDRSKILQLINRPSPADSKEPDEWGEFLHKPGVKFHDFEKIREEIVADTDLKTGGTKGTLSKSYYYSRRFSYSYQFESIFS